MDTSLENPEINASAEIPLQRRFNLTIIFVIGSVLLLIAAGFAAEYTGRRVGEASTIRIGTELAESNATLIGNSFSRVLSSPSSDSSGFSGVFGQAPGAANGDPASGSADPLVNFLLLTGDNDLETLFSSIDFHHMAILNTSGGHVWAVGSEEGLSDRAHHIYSALKGETVSWLTRDTAVPNASGEMVSIDLIESLVPLQTLDGKSSGLTFHIVRDVTEALETNVAATRSQIRNTILATLGILLTIFAALVLVLELRKSRQTQDVLANERHIQEELGVRNSELQRLDDAKNEFLSSLSHELKTPLAAILGFTQILKANKAGNLDDQQSEQLEIINRNGVRLDALINDLLDLSRIQNRRIAFVKEEVELVGFLRDVVNEFDPFLDGKEQQSELAVEHEEAWLSIDQTRIAQVLSNLISNASKYSPKGSMITIKSSLKDDEWIVSVSDEGNGIPLADQDRLFTLFYRTPDAMVSPVSGTGIGLYISKQLIELHEGQIGLESATGRGTTVTVRLKGVRYESSKSSVPSAGFANTLENIDDAV